jgi:hypothetical protein
MDAIFPVAIIGGSAILFLLCREIVCWYFRLKSIEGLLLKILEALTKK